MKGIFWESVFELYSEWVFGELEVPAQKAQTGGWRPDRRCLWPLDVVRWVHTCLLTKTKDSGYIRQRHTGYLKRILREHRNTFIQRLTYVQFCKVLTKSIRSNKNELISPNAFLCLLQQRKNYTSAYFNVQIGWNIFRHLTAFYM